MSSVGPLGHFAMSLEREAMSDVSMLPDTPGALVRQWRSFDRDGSALGALINVGWVAAGGVPRGAGRKGGCLGAEPAGAAADAPAPGGTDAARSACPAALRRDRRLRVRIGLFLQPPLADRVAGVTASLLLLGFYALIRWRAACVVVRVLLRPRDPAARLIDLPDDAARRLARFLSAALLGVMLLLAFGRYGLEDVGQWRAAHHRADRRRAGVRALRADRLARPRGGRGPDPRQRQRSVRRAARRAVPLVAADRVLRHCPAAAVLLVRPVARPVVVLHGRGIDLGGRSGAAGLRAADRLAAGTTRPQFPARRLPARTG